MHSIAGKRNLSTWRKKNHAEKNAEKNNMLVRSLGQDWFHCYNIINKWNLNRLDHVQWIVCNLASGSCCKHINNAAFFEKLPFPSFSVSLTNWTWCSQIKYDVRVYVCVLLSIAIIKYPVTNRCMYVCFAFSFLFRPKMSLFR